ncbi:MAG TPA: branched-chain amino acid ABC transporter permease [Candidatus Limnocylindrales bacterium]|nr:branched-chain amino acid ABC transporter permease [Candidatus Limnocylindrales bacterium]
MDERLLATLTQQLFNALAIGGIYALIALGYTMVYGIIELINFAHGEIFMVGAFFAMTFLVTVGFTGTISDPLVFIVVLLGSFAVVMPVLGLVGVGIERFAYRPLRNAPRLAPLITAIGVSFILQNIVYIWQGPSPVQFPQILSPQVRFSILGASVSYISVLIVVVTAILLIALQLFVSRSRLGRAMRSTAQDRDAAQLMGVNINTTIALTFFLGSALAGAAGIVYGLYFGTIAFNIGFIGGLKAFTAAVLGGIGNTSGAVLGGFIIGFIEVISAQLGLAIWSHAIVFAVLVIVLVFRPSGLLGQPIGERA